MRTEVARNVPQSLAREVLARGLSHCRTVARVGDEFSGLRHPEKPLPTTKPRTRMPRELWDEPWERIEWGRWLHTDHIMLGEARAVVRLLQVVGVDAASHG